MLRPATQLFVALNDNMDRRHYEKVWEYLKNHLEANTQYAHEQFYQDTRNQFEVLTDILVDMNSRRVKKYLALR